MAETSDFHPFPKGNTPKEEFALYTGQGGPGFSPLLSGITWPNPSYEIKRSSGECHVFEYVLDGKGYVRQGEKLLTLEKGEVDMDGMVDSLIYSSNESYRKSGESLFNRLFR